MLGRIHESLYWCKELVVYAIIRMRYARLLRCVRKNALHRKVRVLFLVNETTKWKVQSLFDRMWSDEKFEPFIVLTIADADWGLSLEELQRKLLETKSFFEQRGISVRFGCDMIKKQCFDLRMFTPDIVFYQQPWKIAEVQHPRRVSKFALTCYVPYYVPNYGDFSTDCGQAFHRALWRYFLLNEQWCEEFRKACNPLFFVPKLIPSGHTMLDTIRGGSSDPGEYVIYAPHWSFSYPGYEHFENYSTFLENGRFLLDYAKRHPEIKWVFKPHPTLKLHLKRSKLMSETEIETYYREWERIGIACYSGDYAKYFNASRAMITDCASFLIEYACTGKPIIHLISPERRINPMPPSRKLFATYYQAHNRKELIDHLSMVVESDQDPLRELRQTAVREYQLVGVDAAANILSHLKSEFSKA